MPGGWYKLDNVAKLFVATNSRRDPRVMRLSCTLTEPVDGALLDAALRRAAPEFPGFQVTLHQGLFWYYLEKTDKLPHAAPEHRPPCAEIYGPSRKNGLLYQVSWYGCRINLDVFHVLADGTGALGFLQTIVCCYLKQRYPDALSAAVPEYDASATEREQDSFRKFYGRHSAPGGRRVNAYHLHGLKLPYDQTQFFEIHVPTGQLIAAAKGWGVSVTGYLGTQLMLSVRAEMPALERGRPVVVSLPVNLRQYYPSATARNFFNTIKVGHVFCEAESDRDVAKDFDAKLKAQLTPENIQKQMDSFEKFERIAAVKPVPLALKNAVVRFFNLLEKKKETVTLSNMGRVTAPEALAPYIRHYAAYCSTAGLFITVCSYGDTLVLGVSNAYRDAEVLKNLVRRLSAAGVGVTLYATEVEEA